MKKWICLMLCILLVGLMAVTASAAPKEPEITLQPQNYNYPEYSVAMYSIKATGTNLTATWYLEYEGKTYNLSDNTNGMEPWEAYAGETYGPTQNDPFTWFFGGIESGLNGALIWCVVEDGHYSVASQKAIITVGSSAMPATIVSVPAQVTVNQGEKVDLRCVAQAPDGTQLTYTWYQTGTGKLQDIKALPNSDEFSDSVTISADIAGTHYYVCGVFTSDNGIAYSSIIPVTVLERGPQAEEPVIKTASLPNAAVGQQYSVKLSCTDPAATFSVYYNPGKANDFDKTGLKLAADGTISGIPTAVGSFTFTVCAGGAGGEAYQNYTLTITEADIQETTAASDPTETTAAASEAATTGATGATEPSATEAVSSGKEEAKGGLPWWALLLIGLGAAGAGAGVAILLVKKKS